MGDMDRPRSCCPACLSLSFYKKVKTKTYWCRRCGCDFTAPGIKYGKGKVVPLPNEQDRTKPYRKNYYNTHSTEIKRKWQEYYNANTKKCRDSQHEYYENNKERIKRQNLEYYRSHKDYYKEYNKKYRAKNREKEKERYRAWKERGNFKE